MVDEFIEAVTQRWKNVMIHFEDFATPRARGLLAKYRKSHFVFNDDIQGTASVSVAAIFAALRKAGIKTTDLKKSAGIPVVCAGAGYLKLTHIHHFFCANFFHFWGIYFHHHDTSSFVSFHVLFSPRSAALGVLDMLTDVARRFGVKNETQRTYRFSSRV